VRRRPAAHVGTKPAFGVTLASRRPETAGPYWPQARPDQRLHAEHDVQWMSRIFTTSVASVYAHYVTKVEKKGRTKRELHQVIEWLTGLDEAAFNGHLASGTTFEDFFAAARLNPRASLITGPICGVRVEDIDDPLMQKIR
jgi:hypothetical protein